MLQDSQPTLVLHTDATNWVVPQTPAEVLLHVEDRPTGRSSCDRCALPRIHAGTPAYLIYTSGSTGRPKGVVMAQAALNNMLDWHLGELGPDVGRRVAQFTAIGFDIAVQEIFSTMISGGTLVVPGEETRRDPARLARWLGRRRITDLFAPNLVVEAVCNAALQQGLTLPDLTHVAQAGEQLTLSAAVRSFFRLCPGRRLHNHYGPTETHAATSYVLPPSPDDWPDMAPVGRPITKTGVLILDADLEPVPGGAEGEVYITGAALARGYHGRPDLTADRFMPAPYGAPGSRMYRTGDIGRVLPDGMLVYLGRSDQQVKIRGVRVELGEVDAVIRTLPEVRDVTIVVRGEGPSKRLDAYLVPAPGAERVAERTREHLTRTLPDVMVPATFTLLSELPANANGKVDRNALPDPEPRTTAEADRPAAGLADNREEVMARLLAETFEVGHLAPDDDLLRLGINSLSAATAAARVKSVMGLQISVADIFEHPSVRQLCAVLRSPQSAVPPIVPASRDERLPASFAQERLWVVDQIDGHSNRYNVPVAIRLSGPLDSRALRAAVCDLVGRHEALRTRIVPDGTGLGQEILPAETTVEVAEIEVAAERLEDALLEVSRRPFDLAAEVPFRAYLFRSAPSEHVLLLLIHHIAVDGLSIKPLAKDIGFAYAARLAGLAPPWRPLPVQYADYAAWQRALFDEADLHEPARRQIDYWRSALRGAPELLTMDASRERPQVLAPAGDRVPLYLDPALHRALHELAGQSGSTMFMIVHAALAVVLNQRGAGTDIVVGAAIAGRSDGALDDLVGFFVNTLALRTDLSGEPTLGEILERVRATDLRALEHQELPFDWVVDLMRPERSMAYNPLVQVYLGFQVSVPESPQMPGLDASLELLDLKVAKFDLTFELTECFDHTAAHQGVRGHLEYATDLFDQDTAGDLVRDFVQVLEAATADRGSRPTRSGRRALSI